MELVNDVLWQRLFAEPPAIKLRTRLAEPMTEGSFREALLHKRAGWLGRLLFDPQWRADILRAMHGVDYCWGFKDDGGGGSHFFHRINAKGEMEDLRVEGDYLVSIKDPEFRVPFIPDVIAGLLQQHKLGFGIFLQMATLFYFGILPLGGPMQINYATEIRARLERFLEAHDEEVEAEAVGAIPIDRGFVAGPTVAFAEHADGRVVPATAVDIVMSGGLTMAHLTLLAETTLANIMAVSWPSIHEFTIGGSLPPELSMRTLLAEHGLTGLILRRPFSPQPWSPA